MIRFSALGLTCSVVAGCVALMGCGRRSESDTDATSSVTFADWCKVSGSNNCSPSAVSTSQKEWDAGLSITTQLLTSPTSITLSRSDFDNAALRDLFFALGSADIFNVVRSLPWESLNKDIDGFALSNKADGSLFPFNGIRLSGSKKVGVRLIGKQIRVSGISMLESKATRVIQSLDLSQAGFVNVVTDKGTITKVPIAFFAGAGRPNVTQGSGVELGKVVKAVSSLALDEKFEWRRKITILFKTSQLSSIKGILKTLTKPDPVSDSVLGVIAASEQLMLGGEGTNMVAQVSRKSPVACKFKIVNVPVLGNVNLELKFAAGFGIVNLRKGQGTTLAQADVYGVETNFGKLKLLNVEAQRLVMSVGNFQVPMDFEPKATGPNAIRVEGGSCSEAL
jgi:hypothetical protein